MQREMPKLGFLAHEGFETWSPAAICRGLADIGYSSVEWSWPHFNPRIKHPQELVELATVPAEFGMAVTELAVPLDYVVVDETIRRDRIAWSQECIVAAAEIGVHIISLSTGPQIWTPGAALIPEQISEGTAWDMVFDAFDQLVPTAEHRRVYLVIEGVGACWPMTIILHCHCSNGTALDTWVSIWIHLMAPCIATMFPGSSDSGMIGCYRNILKGDMLAGAQLSWELLQALWPRAAGPL